MKWSRDKQKTMEADTNYKTETRILVTTNKIRQRTNKNWRLNNQDSDHLLTEEEDEENAEEEIPEDTNEDNRIIYLKNRKTRLLVVGEDAKETRTNRNVMKEKKIVLL